MRSPTFALLLMICAACGDSTSTNPIDASLDHSSTADSGSEGSAKDSSSNVDSSTVDSSIPYEAGSLDMCNPNDPSTCGQGQKCCSEPTHKMPPSAYICVTPNGNACPMFP